MRVGSIAVVIGLVLAASAQAAPERILYVGDSLGVGTTPLLQRDLGSSAQIQGDSRIGRPSSEGLRVLGQLVTPADQIVVFDLGTNDDPANPSVLASDLRAARRASGGACMIVATLNRPPLNGVPVDGLNQAVLAFASAANNVQLVDWNAIVSSQPDLLGPDHVHPTPRGYALRAQLFAQAVASCGKAAPAAQDNLTPTPAPAPKASKRARRRERAPAIKVPGIESSGISFTVPLRFRGLPAQLLLPNTKPPYPGVVMLRGSQPAAEFLAAHGIATLTFRDRGVTADANAAVRLLRRRKEIRRNGVGLWAFGEAAPHAAEVAAEDPELAAVVLLSPRVITRAQERAWSATRGVDAPAVTTWLKLRARSDAALSDDPAADWRQAGQPLLAIWGTRDTRGPIRANAVALRNALSDGPNRDRTFRWFNAGHGGAVGYRGGLPEYAPGLLEEAARWLGLHLGARRARPVVSDALPPANGDQGPSGVANASVAYTLPVQLGWLLLPLALLGAAALTARRRRGAAGTAHTLDRERIVPPGAPPAPGASPAAGPSAAAAASPGPRVLPAAPPAAAAPGASSASGGLARVVAVATGSAMAALVAIAGGVALVLGSGSVKTLAGTPWPFALAFVLVALSALATIALARRRAFLVAIACAIWIALALFWLL